MRREAGQVRGVLAERVVVSAELDPFLSLRALAGYSGLSIRKLRDLIAAPMHPLPHYRVGGKLLIRRSDFDQWIARYRHDAGAVDADALVNGMLSSILGRHR